MKVTNLARWTKNERDNSTKIGNESKHITTDNEEIKKIIREY